MVRMVSTGSPPVPLPVQVPPGHVLHQIVDERGTLRHVILSPAPAAANQQTPGPAFGPAGAPTGPVGALPLATPTHPPPPPPHYVSIDHIFFSRPSSPALFPPYSPFSLISLAAGDERVSCRSIARQKRALIECAMGDAGTFPRVPELSKQ